MPLANYCRKCKAEVPDGESCPYCGAKLTKTGERLSFGISRAPWRDWFCWNRLLRVGLPVWGISFLVISLAELCSGGTEALAGLFRRGFGLTMLWLLGGPWERMKRVKIWREGQTLLFFDPAYWQVLAVSCPVQEFPEAESWVRTKMKRFKTVRVLPAEKGKTGKKAKKR